MLKKLLGLPATVGNPVSYSVDVKGKTEQNKFYLLKLVSADAGTENFSYKETVHLFTQKELKEGMMRYYCDVGGVKFSSGFHPIVGYMHPITYNNKHEALTTRFVCQIRFKGECAFNNGTFGVLFTPREVRRSIERVVMYIGESRMKRFGRFLLKLKRVLFSFIFLSLMAGCMNLVYRPHGEVGGVPYPCTRIISQRIADGVAGPFNGTTYYTFRKHLNNEFTLPWLILDLPFDAVVDTVCLPFDW